MNHLDNPNFFEKLGNIFKKWDEVPPQLKYKPLPAITRDNFTCYSVIKQDGNKKTKIAWNLTLNEAKKLRNLLHDKMIGTYGPNTIGEAYFKVERYEIGLGS